jgi:glutathione S-transferase
MDVKENKLVLHSYRRCPFAMRVRMVLHEKGIAFETLEENLKDMSPALQARHPEAKVPVLVHGQDRVVYESAVITQYLEEMFPTPALMPQDAYGKAQVRLWTHWCNHTFKHHVDHYKYGTHRTSQENADAAPERLQQDLAKLEQTLQSQTFLMGDHLTLADIHVFPFLRQLSKATPFFEALDDHPCTMAWLKKLLERPSFVQTMEKKK